MWAVTVGEGRAIGFQFTSTVTEKSRKSPRRAATVHRRSRVWVTATQRTTRSPSQEAPFHFQLFREHKAPNAGIQ